MKIKKVWALSFSPTGTSKKIVDTIVTGISGVEQGSIDVTQSEDITKKTFTSEELVVIGVPVYAGRVAPLAVERLKNIKGSMTPAVLVVLYGNREYEDALIELRDIAVSASFVPVAAAAFIGEHSFSSADEPIAAGRPDAADINTAISFSNKIMVKLKEMRDTKNICIIDVPGTTPYKDGVGSIPVTPHVDQNLCTNCGLCISKCPAGAISIEDHLSMDVERCIFCCACIKICPENAVCITAPPLLEKRQWLHQNYAQRKDPEIYL